MGGGGQNLTTSGNPSLYGASPNSNDPFGIGMNPLTTQGAPQPYGTFQSNDPYAISPAALGDPNAVPVRGGPVGGQFNKGLWNYDPMEHLQGALGRMGYGGGAMFGRRLV